MKAHDPMPESFGRHLDGVASAEESRALEAALLADPALRAEFLRYLNVDLAIDDSAPSLPRHAPSSGGRKTIAAIAAAAAIVMLACVPFLFEKPAAQPAGRPLLALEAAAEAVWADDGLAGEPGSILRLVSGRAEFETLDGARVWMEGPAAIRMRERNRLECLEGRLLCECPTPQSRLTVETAQTMVVDLGTVFSVDARDDASTHVAVLRGEVELRGRETRRLRDGEAAEVRSEVIRIAALSPGEAERLTGLLAPDDGPLAALPNMVGNPGFDPDGDPARWQASSERVTISDGLARVRADGARGFPGLKQRVDTGEIAGRLLAVSVLARSPEDDPLSGRQHAVLKLAFLDQQGREFACAYRHFFHADRGEPRESIRERLVVAAPSGTHAVQVQLLLNTGALTRGSVVFDDARLVLEPSN